MTDVLTELRAAYEADRAERLAGAIPEPPPNICRYCGQHRWELPGSRLDGHARCVVSHAFKARLISVLNGRPPVSYKAAALALGVDVIRAWYRNVTR